MASNELTIRFRIPPRLDRTLPYQRYYLAGLESLTRVHVEGGPAPLRLVRGVDRKVELERRLQPLLSRLRTSQSTAHVGRYVVADGRRNLRFAIDAHDAGEVRDPEVLDWSDLYFKSNYWPAHGYDDRVVPIVNGNGQLGNRELAHLRALRTVEKDIDLVFVSRIWGGREHNLRLFEQAAAIGVRSELHAIFPPGTPPDEAAAGIRRLGSLGIRVGTEDLPPTELWGLLSRARIVLLRAGKHLCVPWRMVDLLAMGACVVLDARFRPEWPVPLVPDVNYLDCNLERPSDTSPAPAEQYTQVGETIAAALREPDRLADVRRANARYFDEHAAPERVGSHILAQLRLALAA